MFRIFCRLIKSTDSKFLNIHIVICLTCWQRIAEFHKFLKNLAHNQYNIYEDKVDISTHHNFMPLKIADETFSNCADTKSLFAKTTQGVAIKREPNEVFDVDQKMGVDPQVKWLKTEDDSGDLETVMNFGDTELSVNDVFLNHRPMRATVKEAFTQAAFEDHNDLQSSPANNLQTCINETLTLNIKDEFSAEESVVNLNENYNLLTTIEGVLEAPHKKPNTRKRPSQKDVNKIISQWKTSLECGVCQTLCADFILLRQHFSLAHPDDKPHIVCCKHKLFSRYEVADHAVFHMNPEAFKCQDCGKCYEGERQRLEHRRRKHSTLNRYKCDVCNKSFPSAFHMKEHMSIHTKANLYKCPVCSITSAYLHSFKRHLQVAHLQMWSETPNKGSFFETTQLDSENEKREVRTHRRPQDCDEIIAQWKAHLECGICQKPQKDFVVLKQHFSEEHSSEEAHILCCKRKLTTRAKMASHANFHMDPELYKCPECGKCIRGRELIYFHKNYHKNAGQTYKCLSCSGIFKKRTFLNRHLKATHPQIWSQKKNIPNFYESMKMTNEELPNTRPKPRAKHDIEQIIAQWKPYLECGVCQKSYKDFTILKQHFSLEHANEKAYILCCKQKLLTHYEIADHASLHSNPAAFKCHDCGKCHINKRQMNRHILQFHAKKVKGEAEKAM